MSFWSSSKNASTHYPITHNTDVHTCIIDLVGETSSAGELSSAAVISSAVVISSAGTSMLLDSESIWSLSGFIAVLAACWKRASSAGKESALHEGDSTKPNSLHEGDSTKPSALHQGDSTKPNTGPRSLFYFYVAIQHYSEQPHVP